MKLVLMLALSAVLSVTAATAADVPPADWRAVDPDNLVLIDTKYGQVAVELAPRIRAQPRGAAQGADPRALL